MFICIRFKSSYSLTELDVESALLVLFLCRAAKKNEALLELFWAQM